MKTLLSLLLAAVIFSFSLNAQSIITITSQSGSTKTATSFKAAVEAAQNGDFIYLPAGSFDVNNVEITKKLHIIGAGYNPTVGAGHVTICLGYLYICTGADGGSIQGVRVNQIRFGTKADNQVVKNYTIQRCHITDNLTLFCTGDPAQENILIRENIIQDAVNGPGKKATGTVVENNIIISASSYVTSWFHNTVLRNNIFIKPGGYTGGIALQFDGAIYENNIFVNLYHTNYTNLQLTNNIYTYNGDNALDNDKPGATGNKYLEISKVFKKYTHYTEPEINFADDFHLTDEAINLLKGTDGTQVGIYGSANPFKANPVPVNPFIKESNVNTMTNAKGKLQIKFQVEAQTE